MKMRSSDIYSICGVLICILFYSCGREIPPPNIVFVLADDQRNNTLGCAGHPIIKTPNIDDLAAEGIRFEHAFVTTSICAASRASILTGVIERTHGFTFGTPPLATRLMHQSYPSLLRGAGYRTGYFGKFGVKMEGNADTLFDAHTYRDRPYWTENGHIDVLNTNEALDFLDSCSTEQPFFLSLSFSSAHAADGDHIPGDSNHFANIPPVKPMYDDVQITSPRLADSTIYNRHPDFLKNSLNRVRYFWRWDTPEKFRDNIQAYYGMISGIDYMVGQIRDKLKDKGLDDNTIIIYSADNGYYMGDRGFAGKWSHYEESLRVPLIIYDPRLPDDKRGRLIQQMGLNIDLTPTFLDFAEVDIPSHYQGRSLRPYLESDEQSPWRSEFFCEHLMVHEQLPKWEGIRDQRYVYARYFEQNPAYEYLHDLEKDPDQLNNYINDAEYSEILKKLRQATDDAVASFGNYE